MLIKISWALENSMNFALKKGGDLENTSCGSTSVIEIRVFFFSIWQRCLYYLWTDSVLHIGSGAAPFLWLINPAIFHDKRNWLKICEVSYLLIIVFLLIIWAVFLSYIIYLKKYKTKQWEENYEKSNLFNVWAPKVKKSSYLVMYFPSLPIYRSSFRGTCKMSPGPSVRKHVQRSFKSLTLWAPAVPVSLSTPYSQGFAF